MVNKMAEEQDFSALPDSELSTTSSPDESDESDEVEFDDLREKIYDDEA